MRLKFAVPSGADFYALAASINPVPVLVMGAGAIFALLDTLDKYYRVAILGVNPREILRATRH